MQKTRSVRKKVILFSFIGFLAVLGITAGVVVLSRHATAPAVAKVAATTKPQPTPEPSTPAPAAFDKTMYSTSDASSLWVVVNKQHPLNPIDYTPSDLVMLYGHQVSSRMSDDLQHMMADSTQAGVNLTVVSSYRSYQYQVNLYNSYVASDSQADADTYSARPGYSEHQTGLAIDFGDKAGKCIVEQCYGDTPEGEWLASNAWKYGFLLRYTTADQATTGYESEPWHYRYVGRALAAEMRKDTIPTLEQFFGISGGATYVQ